MEPRKESGEERRKRAVERFKVRPRRRFSTYRNEYTEGTRDWSELLGKVVIGLGLLLFMAVWILSIVVITPLTSFGFALVMGLIAAIFITSIAILMMLGWLGA